MGIKLKTVQPLTHLFARLWIHITPHRRIQFLFLFILTIIVSLVEVISIGAVLPFLAVLTEPDIVFNHVYAEPFIRLLGLTAADQLLLPLTVVFGVVALLAGGMRSLLLWSSTSLSYGTGADLSFSIYSRTLHQPYAVHTARNSSEVIDGISNKTNVVITTIVRVLTVMSSIMMLVSILLVLLVIDPFIALVAFGGFGLIYLIIIKLTRKQLLVNSHSIARETTQVIKALQEGLGGIRDVLIDGNQAAYCEIFRNADIPLRRAQASSVFISGSPRYGVEALGMILITVLAYILTQQSGGIGTAIPVLGAFALAAQRALPSLQQVYVGWSGIKSSQVSFQDALDLLDQPLPDLAGQLVVKPLSFTHSINIRKLSFRYSPEAAWVLKDMNLNIIKGSRVGFIGTTGCGKSTLLDIVMGLLQPTVGSVEIDGQAITMNKNRAWQKNISHVPQVIFLADSTIAENIAFGVPKKTIDYEQVRKAARQANIANTIETWPNKYQTTVGERGVRLSGGQRQRIGIARALYKQADVIVFDEATSALDNETEQAVMQAIEGLSSDLTVLIIAHRLTTLKNCTQIVEMGKGGIKRVGSYQDLAT